MNDSKSPFNPLINSDKQHNHLCGKKAVKLVHYVLFLLLCKQNDYSFFRRVCDFRTIIIILFHYFREVRLLQKSLLLSNAVEQGSLSCKKQRRKARLLQLYSTYCASNKTLWKTLWIHVHDSIILKIRSNPFFFVLSWLVAQSPMDFEMRNNGLDPETARAF